MEGITGVVKSFGLSKGYGFIESESIEGDIFFAIKALPQDLKDGIDGRCFDIAGREVTFTVDMQNGKTQAHGLQLVPREGQPLVGKVKSFNPTKGYGFIGAEALMGQDIFFMKTELPPDSHFSNSLSGTPCSFSVVQTPEGKIQAQGVRLGGGGGGFGGGGGGFDAGQAGAIFAGMDPTQLGLAIMSGQIPLPGFGGGGGGKGGGQKGGGGGGGRAGGRQPSTGESMSGTVKTFNHMKGWGFIASPSGGKDIYFKSSDGSMAPGMQVSFTATVMPDGAVQARDVVAGHGAPAAFVAPFLQKRGLDTHAMFNQPAKRAKFSPPSSTLGDQSASGLIKSYHTGNLYGFINCAGVDVYFKGNNLPPGHAQRTDLVGQQVTFEVNQTPDGKLQAMPGIIMGGGQS